MVDDYSEKEKSTDTQKPGVSRRDFLKRSGILAGAAAVGAATTATTIGMTGCTDNNNQTTPNSTQRTATDIEFDVYDSEVLVLGSGFAGSMAAVQAFKEGCQVTVVDKAPFKSGGAAGLNWDAGTSGPPSEAPTPENQRGVFPGTGIWADALANKKLGAAAIAWTGSDIEPWNRQLAICRMGNTTFLREEDGTLENRGGVMASIQMIFTRHPSEYLYTYTNAEIVDQTMITGLFMVDGKCIGAMGVHTPTGRYRVFRSKATIIANGGSCQMYGWSGTGAISINSPDNTGDVSVAAFRNGAALVNTEFFTYDMISRYPDSIGGSFMSGIGADSVSSILICDSNDDFIFTKEKEEGGYGPITQECSMAVRDGRGSENDCLYLDLSQPGADLLTRPAYRRNIALWKKIFDIDVTAPGHRIEISVEPFEHMGSPVIDENGMTDIPGLFNVRGIGNTFLLIGSHWMAPYIGHSAAKYASGNDFTSNDWSSIEAEIARLEEILHKEGSLRPHAVRHAVQQVCFDALHIGADAEGLEVAIAELKRIRDEELPKMTVVNKTRCYNTDWRKAIENHNIIDMAVAALEATLMREESRLFYYRADFPKPDDENWLANILVRYNDGDYEYEKRPVVQA